MRWVLRLVFAIAALVLAAIAALFLMPSDRIARLLTDQVEAATGARLEVKGAIRPTLWPEPGIALNGVRLAVPGQQPVLEAEALSVGVASEALWGGEIRVTEVRFDSPVIRLVKDAEGRTNWALPDAPAQTSGGLPSDEPTATKLGSALPERIIVRDGTVVWRLAGQPDVTLTDLSATIARDGRAATIDITGDLAGEGGARPLAVTARLGDLSGALDGAVVATDLSFAAGSAKATFAGRAGIDPLQGEGRLDADLPGLSLLGLNVPEGFGLRAAKVSGAEVTYTAARSAHVRNATVLLDGTAWRADLDLVTDGPRPKLSGRLRTEGFTFGGAGSGGAGGQGGTAPDAGWSKDQIDASALGLIDADLRLDAGRIEVSGQTFAPVAVRVTIDRARAVLDMSDVGALGGTLTGTLVANDRKGLSVGGDVAARGIDLALLAALAGSDRFSGRGNLALKFLGVGNTVDAIMRSLQGNGSLALAEGQIRGIDLGRALGALDPAAIDPAAVTPVEDMTATFGITAGMLSNDDLVLRSPGATVTGKGTVDLGEQRIAYRLLPAADTAGGTVQVPLLVTGPWADPDIRLDLEGAAEARLRAEEDRLRAEAEERLKSELGLAPAEGESLEDAARRKLEEEALKGLGRLLGGD